MFIIVQFPLDDTPYKHDETCHHARVIDSIRKQDLEYQEYVDI
jgi:hypothetical protein